MKTIAIFFTQPGFDDDPFDDPQYRDAYYFLGKLLQEKGIRWLIARGIDTYKGDNVFTRSWLYDQGTFRERTGDIEVDLVFNKGKFEPRGMVKTLNDPELEQICDDKAKTYKRFTALCPRSHKARTDEELRAALDDMSSDRMVVKPLDKGGGEGIVIGTREEILASPREFPLLVQEFVDTSAGIPGLTPGHHDFRINVLGGRIPSVLLRIPQEGSLLANVSQGGSKQVLPPDCIPAPVHHIIHTIDEAFAQFPTRFYSIDVGRDRSGQWKLFELNSQPGVSYTDWEENEYGKDFFFALRDLLVTAVS